MLLGDDLLAYLVLALGAALVVGNLLALVRPPRAKSPDPDGDSDSDEIPDLAKPPLTRTLTMIGIGLIATIWSLATFATT
ncbi:MAG: hypothetical protein ACRDRT_06565 [Pseudonocardiaceae bacterium]